MMTKAMYFSAVLSLLAIPITSVFAASDNHSVFSSFDETVSAYRLFQQREFPTLKVPTVVEVPVDEYFARTQVAVFSETSKTFLHSRYQERAIKYSVNFSAESLPRNEFINRAIDNNKNSFVEYPLVEDGSMNEVEIRLVGTKPATSTALSVLLDRYAALPETIQVSVLEGNAEKIVLATTPMTQEIVHFPKTTAQEWIIRLTFSQPLRISELTLRPDDIVGGTSKYIRFLAQPGESYRIYVDADRYVIPATDEGGDLSDDRDVMKLENKPFIANAAYKQSDADADGVFDVADNCIDVKNANQADVNKNGRGDACDDFDKDGIKNVADNCPDMPNKNQADTDADGKGDACDTEESRLTEKYAWLPWVAIGAVAVVMGGLFVGMLRRKVV